MSEVRTALLNYLRSLDANDAGGSAGGEELRAALSTALGDTDLAAARAEAKKDPASVDAVASLIARMILDEVDPKEIVNTAKVSAQRAPRNADGNDVALLAGLAVWKVGGDPKVAEPYFRRVRRGAPDNADLLAFYREVYSGEKDASQLMQVLVQARRAIKDDTAARLALAEEMADIAEHKLGSVDRAIEVWRSVLREDGYDPGAASALSRLYRAGEKWTALVELLKDQFERVEDGEAYKEERISRLLEIAEIYRDNLNLDAMALATLQRILEIDPRHDASLKALAETYGNAGRWNDLLAVYNRLASAAEAEGDTARQIDMLRRIAAIYLDELTDPEHGLAPLKTVLELDPGDRDALQLIARVHELRGDWDALLELLREQLDGADATEACELRVRIARVTQERFDVEQAQAAWNDVLQAHGDVEEALVALAAIYEKDGRWAEVAEMLHRRVKVEADPARAIELLTTLGQLYVDKLGDADASTRVWEEVARLQPGHPRATETLRDTYVVAERWDDLITLFESQDRLGRALEIITQVADGRDDVPTRVTLYRRVASLYRDRLNAPERGLPQLEKILELTPEDRMVAHELLPIYREQQDWEKLVAAYKVLLGSAEDDDERLEYIAAIRDVALHKLENPPLALEWAGRAYQLRPDDEVLRAGLESAAERSEGWTELVRLFEERLASDACDTYERLELLDKLAVASRDRLRNIDAADAYFQRILELEPNNESTLAALEALYNEHERWEQLAGIHRRRLAQADGIDARLVLLRQLATLQERRLSDREGAVATLEEILELAPTDLEALEGQARIHRATGNWRGLVAVLDRRLGMMDETEAQIPVLFERSKIQAERLHDSQGAVDGFLKVLVFEPDHLPTIDALEHLRRADPSVGLPVMRGLLPFYRSIKDRAREAQAMEVIANHEPDPGVRRLQLTELLGIYQRLGGREEDILRVRLSLFITEPLDAEGRAGLRKQARDLGQLPLVAESFGKAIDHISERITKAEAAGREVSDVDRRLRRELRIERGSLLRDYLDRPRDAEAMYAAILDEDETHQEAYEALEELLKARGGHAELIKLYRRRVDTIFDAEEQRKLLERIVKIARALDDTAVAVKTAEELLDLNPDDLATIELLAGMYELSETRDDHYALEELLGRWIDLIDDEGKQRELKCRRAALRMNRLEDYFGAVELLTGVIEADNRNARARELLEKLLDVDQVKLQVATLLEPIYVQLDDHDARIRVLQVRRESAEAMGSVDEATNFLLQIAQIEEIDLNKPEQAFVTLREAYLLVPQRTDTRAEIQRLGIELDRQRDLVEIWQSALARTDDRVLKIDLLTRSAVLLDEYLHDTDAARQAYRDLIELDPPDPALVEKAVRALVRLHRAAGDHAALVEALRGLQRFTADPEAQVKLCLEIASIQESVLDDLEGASTAYYEVLDFEPENTTALDALERIFAALEDWNQLCDVLRQRVEVVTDDHAKAQLWRKIGEVWRDKVENLHTAIEAFQWIIDLDVDPAFTERAIEDMVELNARLERWPDVEEELRRLLELVDDDERRASLLVRRADVVGERLLRYPDAADLLGEVLIIDPSNTGARERLKAMFEHEDVRDRVVDILRPLFEAEQDWEALVDLEERKARSLTDDAARVDALLAIADTYERRLGDEARAFELLRTLLVESGELPRLSDVVDGLERLAGAQERAEALLAAYEQAVDAILDAEVLQKVLRNMGALALNRLERLDVARVAYERVLELAPSDGRSLDALELIYVSEVDSNALADLLVRRADLTDDDAKRDDLWIRAAELLAGELARPEEAIELYERLSEEAQGRPKVVAALEQLYERTERYHDLASFLERRLEQLDADERVTARLRIAAIQGDRLGNVEEGLRHFAEALRLDPERALATGSLDRYLGDEELRPLVVELLEPVFAAIGDWPRLVKIQELRLAQTEDAFEQGVILTKMARLQEEQLEDLETAYDTFARVFALRPTDVECRAQLARLAAVLARVEGYARLLTDYVNDEVPGDDGDEVLDVVREAAQLWVSLEQFAIAVPLLERTLGARPEDRDAFAALEDALSRAEMWTELAEVYWREADGSLDEDRQREILARVSSLALNVLADDEMAARAFRRILELDPSNEGARGQLEAILERTEQWEALVEALRDRQTRTEDPDVRLRVMLQIAELQDQQIDDPTGAVDTLEAALLEVPGDPQAISALELISATREGHRERIYGILRPIYEEQGNVQRLVAIDEWKLTVTDDPISRHAIFREMAQLYEPQEPEGPQYAFRVLLRALSEPGPDEALFGLDEEVDRMMREIGAFEVASEAMIEAAEASKLADEPERRVALLVHAASVQLSSGDNNFAVDILRKALVVIEDHPRALELLDDALLRVGRYEELVDVLERRIRISDDDSERLEFLRRLARLLEDTLERTPAAVEAWRQLLDLEPQDAEALARLRRAYEAAGATAELAEVLERQVDAVLDPDDRRKLRRDLAALHHATGDRPAEIDALRALLLDEPGDDEAMAALATALTLEERHGDAAEVMLDRAHAAQTDGRRAALLLEVARVHRGPLADPMTALGHYESVLQADSGQMEAIADLVAMTQQAETSDAAASLVLPYLDQRGRYQELAVVLEARSRLAGDPLEGVEALRRLAQVRWERLHDPKGSLDAYNLLMDRVEPDELGSVLAQAARLSVHLGRADAHVDALARRAENLDLDPQARVQIALSAADIAEEIMGDKSRALKLLAPLIEAGLGDAHLCRSVERLARSLGNKQLLAVALRESSRLVDSDAERAEVLVRLGDAELGAGNLDEAVVAYRDALDVHPGFAGAVAGLERLMELMANQSAETGGPPVEVLDSLERAYQDAGNKPGLARVARIRLLRAEGEERARQLEVLGRLIDEGGGRPHEALEVWGDLLLVDANNELGLTRLVELAENRSLLTDAVRRMAEAIDAAREAERPCFELCIATTKILLEKFGDAQTALRALRPALIENPDSLEALRLQGISARACGELELLHEALAKLATLIDNPEESAPLWREAAQVAEQQGNFQRVREDLEHVIELDESDEGAWHKWLEVLAGTEAWEDLADGLGRRAMITDKEEERHILRHHLARLLVDRLDRVEDAINTYHDMLAARPDDLDVMSEVETLLRRHERWDDVRDVLERKADCVHGDDRVAVLEELARVIADDIGEPTDAIEVYHRILAENPNHRASQQALRGLLSKEERWTELAEVLEARVATLSSMLASSPELVNDLRATVLELAELLADRLAEGERARALLEEVLEADPNDVAALLSLSRVQELAGEHEAMAETLQRAAAMNPTGLPGALLRVRLAKLAATPEEKREHLETALHMHPENLEAAQMLLELSREEGYWEQVAYLLALIGSFEADPAKRRELEIERADILVAKVGDLDEALDALAPIYDEVQDDPEINRRIADALFGSNRFEEARGMYSWLLEVLTNAKNKGKRRSDHHAHYLTRLARISLGLAPEDTEGPLEQLKQAYRLDTTNAETLITLADLHASREEWKETLKLARAMLLQNVDESGLVRRGDIYMRLAHAHVALDELHKAKSMLRRGRQEDPDHPEIEAALTELENA